MEHFSRSGKELKDLFRVIQKSYKFDFAEGRFGKILREFNIKDFSKNYNIREIFFPRKFTPLRFDHSPVSKGTIKKKKKKRKIKESASKLQVGYFPLSMLIQMNDLYS